MILKKRARYHKNKLRYWRRQMGRNDKCFCGSGKKVKKCHFTVKENSKLASIYIANSDFDKHVNEENIRANCPKECSACCSDFFYITENEFLLILDGLLKKGGSTLVNKYIDRANEYHQYLADYFPEIINGLDEYMPKSDSISGVQKYFNDNYGWNRSRNCIFLENGKCSIYEDRPHICRMYGVCSTCEILSNPEREFLEATKLIQTQIIMGSKPIIKRPYPLFYYFSFFLNEKYYETMMKKLSMIRSQNDLSYAKFTESIMR